MHGLMWRKCKSSSVFFLLSFEKTKIYWKPKKWQRSFQGFFLFYNSEIDCIGNNTLQALGANTTMSRSGFPSLVETNRWHGFSSSSCFFFFSFCSLLLLVNTLPKLAGVETVPLSHRRCQSEPNQTGGVTTQPQEPRTREWSTVPVEGVPLPFLHSCAEML